MYKLHHVACFFYVTLQNTSMHKITMLQDAHTLPNISFYNMPIVTKYLCYKMSMLPVVIYVHEVPLIIINHHNPWTAPSYGAKAPRKTGSCSLGTARPVGAAVLVYSIQSSASRLWGGGSPIYMHVV